MRIKLNPKKKLENKNESENDSITKSKNKKTKEKPKPWGKVERLLVLFILLSTTVGSAVLGLSARNWKLPGMPQVSLPELGLEKTYVIEADPTRDQDFKEIEDEFVNKTNKLSGIYGFYVIRLYNNVSYGVNENKIFQAASLIKLPVIASLYIEFENDNLSPDKPYYLKDSDKISGAGSLYYKDSGTKITYREIASLMANQSDNTAFNIARNYLGGEQISKTISNFGMVNTSLEKNKSTPKDIGLFFKNLYKNDILSIDNRDQFLDDLKNTSFENHLRSGIPENVEVSHKYGREVHVVNDAGIIFSDEPFVLVLMSEGVVESEADAIFPELAKLIYEYEINQY